MRKLYISLLAIGLLYYQSQSQDCAGSLTVLLQGSSTADSLEVDIDAQNITCSNEADGRILLTSNGGNPGYTYAWEDIIGADSLRENLSDGLYEVTVTDARGCSEVLAMAIRILNPTNSELAMEDGCGLCVLDDGGSTYFFTAQNEYIAALTDPSIDSQGLGGTEVCLYRDTSASYCGGNPYLQRHWSVAPDHAQNACLKLFFTRQELENLADALPGVSVTAQDLLDNQGLCLTAFRGGREDCGDYETATIYSTGDSPPLSITEEDAFAGIWSVSICTDEFATYYLHACDYALPVELLYFRGQKKGDHNVLVWETASESQAAYFDLEKAGPGQLFSPLSRLVATSSSSLPQRYDYTDFTPGEVDYYRLKMVDLDGGIIYSPVVVLQREALLNTRLYPNLFGREVFLEITLPVAEQLEIAVYGVGGQRVFRQQYRVKNGKHRLELPLDFLPEGSYFVHVTAKNTDYAESFKVVKVGSL